MRHEINQLHGVTRRCWDFLAVLMEKYLTSFVEWTPVGARLEVADIFRLM